MLRVLGFGNMRKDEPCEDLYSLPVAVWKLTEFIHYMDLRCAFPMLLLKSATDSNTAKRGLRRE